MCKSLDYAKELFDLAEEVRLHWKELHNKLSIVDQKISDVEHFIEINDNLNAAQGYKAYKLLREVLKERRDIKNQINEFQPTFNFANGAHLTNPTKKNQLYQSIKARKNNNDNETTNKKYRVRVLTDIFGDVIE